MKNYVVFDVETPNHRCDSISSIGLLVVEDNRIVNQIDMLVNPQDSFDEFNMELTGITPDLVKDSPSFDEVWPLISDLLMENVVVGHNVVFDLKVLSRSLKRYEFDIPEFDYCCTLRLSRKYFNLNSNKLTNVAKYLNIKYNPHIAIEDARVSYEILEHVNGMHEITLDNCFTYHYKLKFKEAFPDDRSIYLNMLYGMLYVLKEQEVISVNQHALIREWYEENKSFTEYTVFNNLINQLENSFLKDNMSKSYVNFLFKRTPCILESFVYSEYTLQKYVLIGMIKVILLEDITLANINYIYNAFIEYPLLKNLSSYGRINDIIKNSLLNMSMEEKDKFALKELLSDLIQEKTD